MIEYMISNLDSKEALFFLRLIIHKILQKIRQGKKIFGNFIKNFLMQGNTSKMYGKKEEKNINKIGKNS